MILNYDYRLRFFDGVKVLWVCIMRNTLGRAFLYTHWYGYNQYNASKKKNTSQPNKKRELRNKTSPILSAH